MKFVHKPDGLHIKLTWRERFRYFNTGVIRFDKKTSYAFYNHLVHIASDAFLKYGDAKKHGENKESEDHFDKFDKKD